MIIEIRKVFPNMMHIFFVLFIFFGFMTIEQEDDLLMIGSKLAVAAMFIVLNEVYKGVKLDPDRTTVHYGFGFQNFFKSTKIYKRSEVVKIKINQMPDRYYGVDLELGNGEKITIRKIATLDKATEEAVKIENKLKKYWS